MTYVHPQDKAQRATLCFYSLIDLQYRILLFIGELRYLITIKPNYNHHYKREVPYNIFPFNIENIFKGNTVQYQYNIFIILIRNILF
jgi:hypothetical protein